MSVLNTLLGNYADDIARAATNKLDDAVRVAANKADDMVTLYRGIAAPDESTLQRYIDDMSNPNIVPKTYSGGSAYGQGYYFTPAKDLAESYAFGKADMPAGAIMEIQVPRNRFTQISKELGNRPADFDFAAMKRGVPEDIRFETGLSDFQKYMDDNGFWGSVGAGENPNYLVMRNDALSTLKRLL